MSAPAVRPGQALPVGRRRGRRAPARPRVPVPRPAAARIALLVVGAGLGAATALTFTAETASQLRTPGGPATKRRDRFLQENRRAVYPDNFTQQQEKLFQHRLGIQRMRHDGGKMSQHFQ